VTAPLPPTAPLSVRLGARVGPEIVGSVLAGLVLVAVATFAVFNGRSQPANRAILPTPSPSALPTSTATPPVSTPEPAAARPVLDIIDRLLDERAALAQEVEPRRPDIDAIADRLRTINAGLAALDQPIARFESAGFTDLADRVRVAAGATRDAVTNTLRASITNGDAYVIGGRNVVGVMEQLVAVQADLAALLERR
jgi:hypothetical protein